MKRHTFTLVIVVALAILIGVTVFGSTSPVAREGFESLETKEQRDSILNTIESDIGGGANDITNAITGNSSETSTSGVNGTTQNIPAPSTPSLQQLQREISDEQRHTEEIRKVLQATVETVDKLKKRYPTDPKTAVDRKQSRHIEEIREVLANTIRELREDDILPARGTHCGCATRPIVNPMTGIAEEADGCRPPGWMRMMELENRRTKHCDDCPLKPASSS